MKRASGAKNTIRGIALAAIVALGGVPAGAQECRQSALNTLEAELNGLIAARPMEVVAVLARLSDEAAFVFHNMLSGQDRQLLRDLDMMANAYCLLFTNDNCRRTEREVTSIVTRRLSLELSDGC